MEPEQFLKIQRALAEPKRLEILGVIRSNACEGGVTCSMVLGEMNIAQSTFSHHVAELTEAGLIRGVKDGRFFRLSVDEEVVNAYLEELRNKMLGTLQPT